MTNPNNKLWYRSITLWFNFLSVVGIVIESQMEILKPLLTDKQYALLAIGVASVNMYIRLYVHKGLTIKRPRNDDL